ncbi:MAG: acetate--CoA ligase family protein [Candidatus Alcyoniella australis]|nr:acetate--CoA ligase family protein [Candidatus Alcyoniella australis]
MDSPIRRILHPQAVAFVGANNNVTTMGTAQMGNIVDGGFPGRLYPIHPRLDQVLGVKAYRSLDELPEVPDLLVLVVRNEQVIELLDQAGRLGTKHAVVISGGFAEGDDAGQELQRKLISVIRSHGIRMIGPNCIGVLETRHPFNFTYFPYNVQPGLVGLASHSGTYLTHSFPLLRRLDVGLSAGLSLGNEADLDMVDALEYFEHDPHTKAVALYIEGFRRGRAFLKAARRLALKKPVVAMYVGGTPSGQSAAVGHTAAITSDDLLIDNMFRQAGIIRARGPEELYEVANCLALMPPMAGPNIGIITNSGGPAVTAADEAWRWGLRVPRLSESTMIQLRKHMPQTAVLKNPVDLTFTDRHELLLGLLPELLLADPLIDGLLIYGVFSVDFFATSASIKKLVPADVIEGLWTGQSELIDNLRRTIDSNGKPVVGVTMLDRSDRAIRALIDKDLPFFSSPERAVRALAALYSVHRWRALRSGA